MSSQDYDECEKIFCGSWKLERDENLDAFFTAAEMPEEPKKIFAQERVVTVTRDGNTFVEKTVVGDYTFEMPNKLNEMVEWKDREVDPVFHVKTLCTFKDGVWNQDSTPQKQNGGKRYVFNAYVQGDELIVDLYVPDDPSGAAKRIFKRC